MGKPEQHPDRQAIKRLEAFLNKNGAPMGTMSYWLDFYLRGDEDMYGKKAK